MSVRPLLTLTTLLSAAGVAVAAYLVRVHYDLDALVCGTGECEIVQTSSYATVMDIPIAIFGLLMYLSVLALAVVRLRVPHLTVPASTAARAITAAGTLYSGWLTWLELFVIDAICQWCVASAIITSGLFALEITIFRQMWASEPDEYGDAEAPEPGR